MTYIESIRELVMMYIESDRELVILYVQYVRAYVCELVMTYMKCVRDLVVLYVEYVLERVSYEQVTRMLNIEYNLIRERRVVEITIVHEIILLSNEIITHIYQPLWQILHCCNMGKCLLWQR